MLRVVAPPLALIVFSIGASSCQVPGLDLDGRPCPCAPGFTCEAATNICVVGAGGATSTSNPTSTTTTTSASNPTSTTTSSSTSASSGGPSFPPSTDGCTGPLSVTGDVRGVGATVDFSGGTCFKLAFTQERRWQPEKWFDGATGFGSDLGGGIFYRPIVLGSGPPISPEEVPSADVVATLTRFEPAHAVMQVHLEYDNAANVDWPGVELTVVYDVWASGRVGIHTTLHNGGASPAIMAEAYYHWVAIDGGAGGWTSGPLGPGGPGDEKSFAFRNAGLFPNVLLVNRTETDAGAFNDLDGPDALRFRLLWLGDDLDPGETRLYHGELQLGPSGQDEGSLEGRAEDARSPGQPVTPVAVKGFDPASAAYTLTAEGPSVSFAPGPSFTRHRPAFVISGWSSPSFRVMRGGELVVSSEHPSTPRGAIHFDPVEEKIHFVYLDVIPLAEVGEPFVLEVP